MIGTTDTLPVYESSDCPTSLPALDIIYLFHFGQSSGYEDTLCYGFMFTFLANLADVVFPVDLTTDTTSSTKYVRNNYFKFLKEFPNSSQLGSHWKPFFSYCLLFLRSC